MKTIVKLVAFTFACGVGYSAGIEYGPRIAEVAIKKVKTWKSK